MFYCVRYVFVGGRVRDFYEENEEGCEFLDRLEVGLCVFL